MRNIGVGVIGTGFMGKAHSFAYRAVAGIFPGSLRPVLQSVADINGEAAEQAAKQFGFVRWRTDWRALVEDPDIEVVSITTPNVVHREMALAAIAQLYHKSDVETCAFHGCGRRTRRNHRFSRHSRLHGGYRWWREARAGFSRSLGNSEDHRYGGSIIHTGEVLEWLCLKFVTYRRVLALSTR